MAEDYRIKSPCKKETAKAGAVFNKAVYAGGHIPPGRFHNCLENKLEDQNG